jgi:hypothetical protein
MKEYSEQEKQDYINWVNKGIELSQKLTERLAVSKSNKESKEALEEYTEEVTQDTCPHDKSIWVDCLACNELHRFLFPIKCSMCENNAIGSCCEGELYFCKEHCQDKVDFELFPEEED